MVIIPSLIHLFLIKKYSIKKITFLEIIILWNGIVLVLYFLYWAFVAKKYFYKHIGPSSWVVLIMYIISAVLEDIKRKEYFKSSTTTFQLNKVRNKNNKLIKHSVRNKNTPDLK